MGGNGYLKFILTLLTAAVVVFGYLLVSSVDRMRESNLRVIEKLDALPGRISLAAPAQTAASVVDTGAFANREFFDPAAKVGGRMIQAYTADTGNMNYLINGEATVAEFHGLCNSSLAERNYANPEKFEPLLAESWEISPDHKTYRIKLRKGILWHDFTDPVTGKEHRNVEVTAHDFKFQVDVILNPDVNCAPLRGYYQDLEEVKIINDYEFEVRWNKEYYGSMSFTLGMTPLPRHLYHAYDGPFDGKAFNDDHQRNRMIVGCGPYQFVRWDKGQKVVFRRNPKYIGTRFGAAPALEEMVYELIKLDNTKLQALYSGTIDKMGMTPEQWIQTKNDKPFTGGTLNRYQYLDRSYSYIGWNLRNPLFTDAKVRRALTMLIDRDRIVRDVYHGLAESVTGPFLPDTNYCDKSIKPWPCDPAQAKKLLAEAGWRDIDNDGILEKDGRKFVFTILQVSSHSIQERMMPIIKENLATAGIDMKIQIVEWSVYIERLRELNFEVCCLGWTSPFDPDPYQVWHSSQTEKGGSNHVGFINKEADDIIIELRKTFDPAKRIELTHKFGRILHEEQPYTFLVARHALVAQSSRYKNVRVFPAGLATDTIWSP